MTNYKITVNIKIEECNDNVNNQLLEKNDGSFEFILPEKNAINIDKCEKALLQVDYEALRATLAKHFSDISKKRPVKKQKTKDI
jgi:hypothetical protein